MEKRVFKKLILKYLFTKLYYMLKEDNIDEVFLKDICKKDKIFPDIDYMIYY